MALTKYNAQPPPIANQRLWLAGELRKIDVSIGDIIIMLAAMDGTPIQLGPPDSAGLGYRALRIPN